MIDRSGLVPKRTRDFQRSRLYRAERRMWARRGELGPDPALEKIEDCQRYVNRVLSSKSVEKALEAEGLKWRMRTIRVRPGRGCRTASLTWCEMQLPKWARKPVVILHETAHAVTDGKPNAPDHGVNFCKACLVLVRQMLGPIAETQLRECFLELGVKFRGGEVRARYANCSRCGERALGTFTGRAVICQSCRPSRAASRRD